jgi:hypothetical protein
VRELGEILADLPVAVVAELSEAITLATRTARNAGTASAWADARRNYQDKRDRLEAKHAAEVEQLTARAVKAEARADLAETELAKARAPKTVSTVLRLPGGSLW